MTCNEQIYIQEKNKEDKIKYQRNAATDLALRSRAQEHFIIFSRIRLITPKWVQSVSKWHRIISMVLKRVCFSLVQFSLLCFIKKVLETKLLPSIITVHLRRKQKANKGLWIIFLSFCKNMHTYNRVVFRIRLCAYRRSELLESMTLKWSQVNYATKNKFKCKRNFNVVRLLCVIFGKFLVTTTN